MTTANVRRQIQRGREYIEYRQADERAQRAQNRKTSMSQFKTTQGDRVAKPPSSDLVRRQVDELFEAAASALEVVADAARREAAIEQTISVDEGRFPAAVRGDRS